MSPQSRCVLGPGRPQAPKAGAPNSQPMKKKSNPLQETHHKTTETIAVVDGELGLELYMLLRGGVGRKVLVWALFLGGVFFGCPIPLPVFSAGRRNANWEVRATSSMKELPSTAQNTEPAKR